MLTLALALAFAAEPAAQLFSPSQGRRECDLARDSHRFNADMRDVPIDKALRGMADVTCITFKLMPGTTGTITITSKDPKETFSAMKLLDMFVAAADKAGITVKPSDDVMIVEPKKKK